MGLGNKTKAKGKIIKGKTKKHAGKATGNNRLRIKGKAGEATGKLELRGAESQGFREALTSLSQLSRGLRGSADVLQRVCGCPGFRGGEFLP